MENNITKDTSKEEFAKYLGDCKIESMNEVIAIFDGRVKTVDGDDIWWSDIGANDNNVWMPDQLRYHTDWSWIMPVGKKCRESFDALPFEVLASGYFYMNEINKSLQTFSPAMVHREIFNYIEWYNKHTK